MAVRTDEYVEDLVIFIEQGVHPALALEQVGRSAVAAQRALQRRGMHELARKLQPLMPKRDCVAEWNGRSPEYKQRATIRKRQSRAA